MSFIAPNLSIILGASIAAKLMDITGGLTNLIKMPPFNMLLFGSHKKVFEGFSSTTTMPHMQVLFFIQNLFKIIHQLV